VAFDLDGTLYVGSRVVTGAPEVVAGVRARGLATLFVTNASAVGAGVLRERLGAMGIAVTAAEIYSSAVAVARYAVERGYTDVYVVGLPGLHDELRRSGVTVTGDAARAQALVVGFLPGLDPATLPTGFPPAAEFIAANLDADYPAEGGERRPAARETVDKVVARLGRPWDFCAGKPGTYLLECIEADHGLKPAEIVVVGDSATSDVAMARAAGCRSVLIAPDGTPQTGASVVVGRLADVPAALDTLASG
jgi:arabinose operon protein AraL